LREGKIGSAQGFRLQVNPTLPPPLCTPVNPSHIHDLTLVGTPYTSGRGTFVGTMERSTLAGWLAALHARDLLVVIACTSGTRVAATKHSSSVVTLWRYSSLADAPACNDHRDQVLGRDGYIHNWQLTSAFGLEL
jgi:hypothetical protein